MIRKKIMALFVCISCVSLYAEDEKFNLFISGGLGFGMGGQLFSSIKTDASNNTKVTDRFFNYGSGFKIDGGAQYFIMENLSLMGSFVYSPGFKFVDELQSGDYKLTTTYTPSLFGFKVYITPKFEVLELFNAYTGVGMGFFWNIRPFKAVLTTPSGTQNAEGRITSNPALGFTGLLGADFPVSDIITIFGEFAFEQMSFNLSKRVVEESNINNLATVLMALINNNLDVSNYDFSLGTKYYSANDPTTSNLNPVKVPGTNFQFRIGVKFAIVKD
ncbi:MAG: outer membrane beta-barrel protein [Chitinispirillaceae bacterium]|nr:outer membrane beta-barrel protein [Chitinispirillaceae bacterium]